MALNYTTFLSSLANLMVTSTTDPNFVAMAPNAIDEAEGRIYRDMDFLATVVRDSTAALTLNNRNFALPTDVGVFLVVNSINAITPAGTGAATGKRSPLVRASLETLDFLWPASTANTGTPQQYALLDNANIVVGPSPDGAYVLEVIGTQRPAALSAINPTTYLSTYLPDLLLAAAMIFASGFMRNFGSQSDDPKMAMSWQADYASLLATAKSEEARRKSEAQSWAAKQPAPSATPARDSA